MRKRVERSSPVVVSAVSLTRRSLDVFLPAGPPGRYKVTAFEWRTVASRRTLAERLTDDIKRHSSGTRADRALWIKQIYHTVDLCRPVTACHAISSWHTIKVHVARVSEHPAYSKAERLAESRRFPGASKLEGSGACMTMLDRMRRHKNWLKWSLILVCLAFVVFYIPDFLRGTGADAASGDTVARIDGQQITAGEFRRVYQAQLQAYRSAYGAQMNDQLLKQLGVETQILQQLVDERASLAEADRLKIRVSDEEVRQRIFSIPAFQE